MLKEHHRFWQGMRDSNPRKRSQSPVCYRYTNPLNALAPKRKYYYSDDLPFVKRYFSKFAKFSKPASSFCGNTFRCERQNHAPLRAIPKSARKTALFLLDAFAPNAAILTVKTRKEDFAG